MINSIMLGMLGLGGSELLIIMVIVLLLFGGKKLPELMKGLGKGIKDFKEASSGQAEPAKEEMKPIESKL